MDVFITHDAAWYNKIRIIVIICTVNSMYNTPYLMYELYLTYLKKKSGDRDLSSFVLFFFFP